MKQVSTLYIQELPPFPNSALPVLVYQQEYERLKAAAKAVRLPDTDPVMGVGGAVTAHWRQ